MVKPSTDRKQGAYTEYRTDVQGLRAIAVLLVLLFHAVVPFFGGGYVGVDVFFVISGFLITQQLLGKLIAEGRVDFWEFYARRIKRILPVSFFVLIITVMASLYWMPPLRARSIISDAIWTAFYLPNVAFARTATNYLAETAPSPFQHYWSLGIEEQFYLLWPIFMLLAWRASKASRIAFLIICSATVAASLIACLWLTQYRIHWAFFSMPTRAWELGAGALVAVCATTFQPPRRHNAVGSWFGLALISCAATLYDDRTVFPGFAAIVPVIGTVLVLWFGQKNEPSGPSVILDNRLAQWVGERSYSLYLWHWPLLVIPAASVDIQSSWVRVLLTLAAFPLAAWSYRYIENPLRFSLPNASPKLVVGASLGLSCAAAMLFTTLLTATNFRSLDGGSGPMAFVPSDPPVESLHVPSNLQPSLTTASTDVPIIYANGCHNDQPDARVKDCVHGDAGGKITYVLFGDSHAAQWFPALDLYSRSAGIRLLSFTKSSCPSLDVQTNHANIRYRECEEWRAAVLKKLGEVRPDVIVLSNYQRETPLGPAGRVAEGALGLRRMLQLLPPLSQTIVIGDTPSFAETPAVCLSVHLRNTRACARLASAAFDQAWQSAQRAAALEGGARHVDLTRYLCTSICAPVLHNLLVYRDAHHLTASASLALAGILGKQIASELMHVRARRADRAPTSCGPDLRC